MVFDRQVAINREKIKLLNNGIVIRLPGRRAMVSPRWFGIIQRLNMISRPLIVGMAEKQADHINRKTSRKKQNTPYNHGFSTTC